MTGRLAAVGPRRLAALALAVAVTGICCGYLVRYVLKPYTGLVVNFPEAVSRDGAVVFAPRSPLSPAVRAGLVPYRDRILRVGGREITTLRDLVAADLAVRTWAPLAVEVARDSGETLSLLIEPDLALRRPDTAFTVAFLVALLGLAFALLLDRGLGTPTGLLAAACLCYALFVAAKPFYYESLLSNALIHVGKAAPWLLLGFAALYPRARASRAARLAAAGLLAAAFALFTARRLWLFAQWNATGAEELLQRYRDWGRGANVGETAAYVAFAGLLLSALSSASARERPRIQWMLAGFLVALPPYFFFDQLPLILNEAAAPRIGTGGFASLFLLPLPLLFTVGFVTGRSFATRTMLSRFVIYALVAVVAVAFFIVLYEPLVEQLTTHYAMSLRSSALVAVSLLAAFLLPLQAVLLRAVTRRVDSRTRRMRELISENAALRRALDDPAAGEQAREQARQRELARLARHVEQEAERAAAAIGAAASAIAGSRAQDEGVRASLTDLRSARTTAAALAEAVHPLAAVAGGLPEPCDAARLAAAAVARARQRLPGLRAEARVPQIRVRVVPQHIVGALIELLVNACESAPGGLVVIAARRHSGKLRVEVRDQGPGFAPELEAIAGEPFVTGKPGRAGMGLYVAARELALSGATLGLSGQEDGGVVWMDLPLA